MAIQRYLGVCLHLLHVLVPITRELMIGVSGG